MHIGFWFRSFRRALLSLVALISLACIVLTACVYPCISQTASIWVLVLIPGFAIASSLWSISRKALVGTPQVVGIEMGWSFILLPLELILTLLVLAVAPSGTLRQNLAKAYFALEILVFITTAIVFLYTTGLILIAILTARSFDTSVWNRDIDSSPSPFPMSVLLAYVFPCCTSSAMTDSTTQADGGDLDDDGNNGDTLPALGSRHLRNSRGSNNQLCLPGCQCNAKKELPESVVHGPEMRRSSTGGSLNRGVGNARMSGSWSGLLVRIPNEFERRASITIGFEV